MNLENEVTVDDLIEEVNKHLKHCETVTVNCVDCFFKIQRKDLDEHHKNCSSTSNNMQQCSVCGEFHESFF